MRSEIRLYGQYVQTFMVYVVEMHVPSGFAFFSRKKVLSGDRMPIPKKRIIIHESNYL